MVGHVRKDPGKANESATAFKLRYCPVLDVTGVKNNIVVHEAAGQLFWLQQVMIAKKYAI